MTVDSSAHDWTNNFKNYVLIWVLPKIAILGAIFAPLAFGTTIWVTALVFMGAACLMNSRRCGRVHCRYTGPYYLALTVPVLLLGTGILEPSLYALLMLGGLSIFGGYAITWLTEKSRGKYEAPSEIRS